MEMNKVVVGAAAFAAGLLIGKNWKKIADYTTELYNKNIKTLLKKPAKEKSAAKAKEK